MSRDFIIRARDAAVAKANEYLQHPDGVLILDTETTGYTGEIIELAIIDLTGAVVFNSRFKPSLEIEPGALQVHGLSAEILADEPLWADKWPEIAAVLNSARMVLIWNVVFDVPRLNFTCTHYQIESPAFSADCLMKHYARWYGEWNPRRRDFTWKPLNGGHNALDDCREALRKLYKMAGRNISAVLIRDQDAQSRGSRRVMDAIDGGPGNVPHADQG